MPLSFNGKSISNNQLKNASKNLDHPVHSCLCYTRINSRSFAKIAPFPVVRICVKRSFENTGLDLAGRAKERVNKNYIFSFTCMRTWAVHLEVVSEMTTPRLLQAL
ncbi:hypothetical protein T03_2894 [Trichinella britovi]|uniref:Uncharacterized protein n=2 Tax=Trichinella TaxID=6333 RepID=A0A0V1D2G4_TRIBR|nr:hypothetical protein T03_2894 [Trichinella britovi]